MGFRDRLFKKQNTNETQDAHANKRTHDVYICYSTRNKDVADKTCHVLEQNNIKCWIAPRDLTSGKIFADEIQGAIKSAKLVVLVFSRDSQESKYVNNEIDLAFSKNKPILAFNIDGSFPEKKMEYYLRNCKWLEGYPNPEAALEPLVKDALTLLNEPNTKTILTEEPAKEFSVKNKYNKKHPDVFISYSENDKSAAGEICDSMEDRGIYCWLKHRNTGTDIVEDITDAIKNSKAFVLIYSRHSKNSNFNTTEVDMAFSYDIPILAIKIDESELEGTFAFYLSNKQLIDAHSNFKKGVDSLIEDISNTVFISPDIREPQANADIAFSSTSDIVIAGEIIALFGTLENESKKIKNTKIDIYQNSNLIDTVISNESGKFSALVQSDAAGEYDFKAIFNGNDEYKACESDKIRIEVVNEKDNSQSEDEAVKMPVPAYLGDEPYIFISYSHMDFKLTYPEIERYHNKGYNIWYDEGIAPGNEWLEEIAEALLGCSLLVVFISKNSISSRNIKNEVNLALNEDIPILPIYLEEVELPAELKLKLSSSKSILKYVLTDEEYMFACFSAFKDIGIESSKNDEIEEFLNRFNEDEDDEIMFINDDHETIPHVDEVPFPAYTENDEAYAFVSYSHKDYKFVFNEIKRFHEQGLNIWYDEGIAPGNEWLAEIGQALSGASLFIVFISGNSVNSKFVRKEITFAINNDIPFVAIHIEKTKLPIQLDLALGDLQAILQYGMSDNEYYRRYTKAFNMHMKKHGITLKPVEDIL